jgi:hypothetical protein
MDFGSLAALIKILAAMVVAVPLTAYLMQDKLIFQPRPLAETERQAIAARHPDVADIFLQAEDGTRLHAWHIRSGKDAPLVLYFGGNAEEVSWMLDEIPRRINGASWVLVDYRGYGASGGTPSEPLLESDALLWYDRFAGAGSRVYAFGRSLGSGVAVQLAGQRRLDGVVLVAPFDSMVEVGKRHYPYLPVEWLLRHRFDSLSVAPKITAPLLCVVATHDEVIPAEHAMHLYDAWAGPKKLLPLAAGHNSIDGHPEYWPAIGAFLGGR